MDDVTFSARRASAASAVRQADTPTDLDTRFRTLVQSPLRAGILRYLSARPQEPFAGEWLVRPSGGRGRAVEIGGRGPPAFGLFVRARGAPPRFPMVRPPQDALVDLMDGFLERRAAVSTED